MSERPKASASDYEGFLVSPIWRDMSGVLIDHIDLLNKAMAKAEDIKDWRRAQGAIAEVRDLLNFPSAQIELLKDEEEQNEQSV